MSVIIGIDPHKASHVAVAIDDDEQSLGVLEVVADRRQTRRLLAWAELGSAASSVDSGCDVMVMLPGRRGR